MYDKFLQFVDIVDAAWTMRGRKMTHAEGRMKPSFFLFVDNVDYLFD